jgi:hypothetical protein
MRKEIIIPAMGWIVSGIISITVWYIQSSNNICNCPEIPANASVSVVHSICSCSGSYGLLYIGILVILVGFGLIISRNKISKMMDAYKSKRPSK